MSNLIEKWYNKVKPFLFTYKKGFFVLPYVSNTPQLMWLSLQKMPFIKFNATRNISESNTPFLHAKMYYEELAQNLVVFYNEIAYKKNVTFEHHKANAVANEYYCLTGMLSQNKDDRFKTIVKDIHFHGQLWILHKPEAVIPHYHFKDSITKSIIIYFTKEWLITYLRKNPDANEKLQFFIDSEHQSLGRDYETNPTGMALLDKATDLMNRMPGPERTQQLSKFVNELMDYFKSDCLEFVQNKDYVSLGNVDLLNIIKAEKLITDNLMQGFPGISYLAKKVGLSETKLKSNFKAVYKVSAFQYYRQKQMEKAKEMLEQDNVSIKTVASLFGYENASKFSAAFKNHHGSLPSELKDKS